MNIDSVTSLFSSPSDLWEHSLKPYWQIAAALVGAAATAGITIAAIRLLKGWGFLAHYHHDGGLIGHIKSFPLFLLTLRLTLKANVWRAKSTLRGGISFDAARLLTELEILQPAPEKPSWLDHQSERPRREAIAETLPKDLKRRVLKTRLDALYQKAISAWNTAWEEKRKIWEDDWADWKEKRDEAFKSLVTQRPLTLEEKRNLSSEDLLAKLPYITPKKLANIDAARTHIDRYFKVARQYRTITQFVSYVRLERGYFAPLFLVSGLMTRFQQAWEPILVHYRSQLPKEASELLELQSFEFNCWLLWGPSIPLCTCGAWQTSATRRLSPVGGDGPEEPIFYQYGFGDENNSVDVLARHGRSDNFIRIMRAMLLQHERFVPRSHQQGMVGAAPTSILGKLTLASTLHNSQFCHAQKIIQHPDDGRVILDLERLLEDGTDPSNYYSAYIWVMFVVTNLAGEPIHEAKWKNLLPFFEHGNIANSSTMRTLKQALAIKAASTLSNVLRDNSAVIVSFACALDNSNCGAPILYPPPAGESIFDLIAAAAKNDPLLKAELDKEGKGRLVLDNKRGGNAYASCELPGIIDKFDDAIREQVKHSDEASRGLPVSA